MAEYHMTYEEIYSVVSEAIFQSENPKMLQEYQPAIMAAITGNYEEDQKDEISEMIALWDNMIKEPSQLLLGTRYIRIQDVMVELIKLALTSGVVDAVITFVNSGTVAVGIAPIAAVAIGLHDFWGRVSRLEDDDFCIYYQALTHYHKNIEFTEEELADWFPHGENKICNSHNSTWHCDYLQQDDSCGMDSDRLQKALKSLVCKGILKKSENGDGKYVFQFR